MVAKNKKHDLAKNTKKLTREKMEKILGSLLIQIKRLLPVILGPISALMIALVFGAIIMITIGQNPLLAYKELFLGAFGSVPAWLRTLRWSSSLIIAGLAATVAFRAGFFNVGIEGSIWIGGFCTAITGIYITNLPIYIHLPLSLLAGILAGGLWAFIPGFVKAKYGVNEVVFTLMANYIAILLVQYLVRYPFQDEAAYFSYAQTHFIQETAWMPWLNKTYELSGTFIMAIILTIISLIIFKRSIWGYEAEMTGQNPIFAKFSGVNNFYIALSAMVISGALGGLTGGAEVVGNFHRIHERFSIGLGFSGINAALIGQFNPIGVFIGSLFLAGLKVGGQAMERNLNISRDIAIVIQAMILFFITAENIIMFLRKKRQVSVEETL